MNNLIKACIFAGLLVAGPVGAQQKKPAPAGKQNVEIGSVVTDGVCDVLYVPTGPMKMIMDVLMGTASNAVRNATQAADNKKTKESVSSDARSLLKSKARTETWLPAELEAFIGAQMLGNSLMDDDEAAGDKDARKVQQIFNRIAGALPLNQPYSFKLRFSTAPSATMKAIPGGTIVVDWGLIKQDEVLLAALLAHEIAHVTKRHNTRQIQGYLADTMSIVEITQTLTRGRKSADMIAETWMNSAQFLDVLFSAFHTDQELEADACVPRLLKAAGYSPERGVRAFQEWALKDQADSQRPGGDAKPDGSAKVNNNARKKSEDALAKARQAQTVAKGGSRSAQRGGGVADNELFARRHPPGPDRSGILTASLSYWSTRDPGLRPTLAAGESPDSTNASGATALKEESSGSGGIFSTIRNAAQRLKDKMKPGTPAADSAVPSQETTQ
jgi:Zn-dependent protease with chaperone function